MFGNKVDGIGQTRRAKDSVEPGEPQEYRIKRAFDDLNNVPEES